MLAWIVLVWELPTNSYGEFGCNKEGLWVGDLRWRFLPEPEPHGCDCASWNTAQRGARSGPSGDPQLSLLAAAVQSPAESCCSQSVEPHLECVMEELMRPISSGVEAVRSLFAQRVDEMIGLIRSSPVTVLQKEVMRERDGKGSCSLPAPPRPLWVRDQFLRHQQRRSAAAHLNRCQIPAGGFSQG